MSHTVEAVVEKLTTTHLTTVYGEAEPSLVRAVSAFVLASHSSFNACYGGIVKTIYNANMNSAKAHQTAKLIYDDFFKFSDAK
jgi:hypothetical protein